MQDYSPDSVYVYMYHPGGMGEVGRTEEAGEATDEEDENGEGFTGRLFRFFLTRRALVFRFVAHALT